MRADTLHPASVHAAFSSDYAEARRSFLSACENAGLTVHSYFNSHHGPSGEPLACDVAWVGPGAARRVLVLASGTHGVEGFCGSAIQIDWLLGGGADRLPDGVAVLLIHAINPYGFAWLRRVNEDGVDLNRNFIDFRRSLPPDEGYKALAAAAVPRAIDGAEWDASGRMLQSYRAEHGQKAYETALTSGQYTHPEGLFYGGKAATWSRHLLEQLGVEFGLSDRTSLAVIDIHTGLGPFGYGELICDHPPDSPSVHLARRWFGDSVTEPLLGTSTSTPKRGLVDYFWHRLIGDHGCMLTLEFGTRPMDQMLDALRADHWLYTHDAVDWAAAQTQQVKARIRDAFYPGGREWEEMILFRGRQVIRQGLDGVGGFLLTG